MPVYNGKLIENLLPITAHLRGYLTIDEYRLTAKWNEGKTGKHQLTTIVYVNGVYMGTATKCTPLYKIVEKFNI